MFNDDEFELNLEDGVYDATNPYTQHALKQKKAIKRTLPREVEKKRNYGGIVKLIKFVVGLCICIFIISYAKEHMGQKIVLDSMVNMDTTQVESELGITLERNCNMSSEVTHYSEGTLIVDGDGEVGVIYIDGVQKGIFTNDRKYSIFGVKIGDSETTVEAGTTFKYDDYTYVINEMISGNTRTYFYYNDENNDCLVVTYSTMNNKAIGITYYNDYKKIREKLSPLY